MSACVREFVLKEPLLEFFKGYGVFGTTGADWTHVVALVPLRIMSANNVQSVAGHCVSVWRESMRGNTCCRVHVRIVNQIAARFEDQTLVDHKGENGEKTWHIVLDIDNWLAVQLQVFDLDDAFGPLGEGDAGDEGEDHHGEEDDDDEQVCVFGGACTCDLNKGGGVRASSVLNET